MWRGRSGHLRLKQQLLRPKDGNGNYSYLDSDVELPVSIPSKPIQLSSETGVNGDIPSTLSTVESPQRCHQQGSVVPTAYNPRKQEGKDPGTAMPRHAPKRLVDVRLFCSQEGK
jgi:hypothetical protein